MATADLILADELSDITGHCSLCSYPLTTKYSEDFPDDWKWCCGCLALAKNILEDPNNYVTQMEIGYLFRKIYDKMTLVGR